VCLFSGENPVQLGPILGIEEGSPFINSLKMVLQKPEALGGVSSTLMAYQIVHVKLHSKRVKKIKNYTRSE
jgi:hypothetical protein